MGRANERTNGQTDGWATAPPNVPPNVRPGRSAPRRPDRVAGDREAQPLAATLGAAIRAGRRRCRLSQAALGRQVGLGQARVSAIERGLGAGVSLSTWVAFGLSIGQPLAVGFSRALTPGVGPSDAGHLDLQELAARLAAGHGWRATFELPTRPIDPHSSADLAVRDDAGRRLLVLECWNRFGDLGAAVRSSSRKLAEAAGLAALIGGERPYAVALCWLVRPTAENRALLGRYPSLIRSRLPGSSTGWARALELGTPAPEEPGIVWLDLARRRVIPVRWTRTPGAG